MSPPRGEKPRVVERRLVDLGERGLGRIVPGIEAHDAARDSRAPAPDRAVGRVVGDGVEAGDDALVLRRIDRLFGSTYSSRLPLPLVSRMNAVQPCDFSSSPVSSNILRVEPADDPPPPPLVHSVLFASSANIRWCVAKHVPTA